MTSLITKLLQNYLKLFIKDFNNDQIKSNIFKGELSFENIELNELVIHKLLQFPETLQINQIRCSHLHIKIPLTRIKKDPISVSLGVITILIAEEDIAAEPYDIDITLIVDSQPEKDKKDQNKDNKPVKRSWMFEILEHAKVHIEEIKIFLVTKELHAQYGNNEKESEKKTPFWGVNIKNIKIESTDEKGNSLLDLQGIISKNKTSNEILLFKKLKISDISVGLGLISGNTNNITDLEKENVFPFLNNLSIKTFFSISRTLAGELKNTKIDLKIPNVGIVWSQNSFDLFIHGLEALFWALDRNLEEERSKFAKKNLKIKKENTGLDKKSIELLQKKLKDTESQIQNETEKNQNSESEFIEDSVNAKTLNFSFELKNLSVNLLFFGFDLNSNCLETDTSIDSVCLTAKNFKFSYFNEKINLMLDQSKADLLSQLKQSTIDFSFENLFLSSIKSLKEINIQDNIQDPDSDTPEFNILKKEVHLFGNPNFNQINCNKNFCDFSIIFRNFPNSKENQEFDSFEVPDLEFTGIFPKIEIFLDLDSIFAIHSFLTNKPFGEPEANYDKEILTVKSFWQNSKKIKFDFKILNFDLILTDIFKSNFELPNFEKKTDQESEFFENWFRFHFNEVKFQIEEEFNDIFKLTNQDSVSIFQNHFFPSNENDISVKKIKNLQKDLILTESKNNDSVIPKFLLINFKSLSISYFFPAKSEQIFYLVSPFNFNGKIQVDNFFQNLKNNDNAENQIENQNFKKQKVDPFWDLFSTITVDSLEISLNQDSFQILDLIIFPILDKIYKFTNLKNNTSEKKLENQEIIDQENINQIETIVEKKDSKNLIFGVLLQNISIHFSCETKLLLLTLQKYYSLSTNLSFFDLELPIFFNFFEKNNLNLSLNSCELVFEVFNQKNNDDFDTKFLQIKSNILDSKLNFENFINYDFYLEENQQNIQEKNCIQFRFKKILNSDNNQINFQNQFLTKIQNINLKTKILEKNEKCDSKYLKLKNTFENRDSKNAKPNTNIISNENLVLNENSQQNNIDSNLEFDIELSGNTDFQIFEKKLNFQNEIIEENLSKKSNIQTFETKIGKINLKNIQDSENLLKQDFTKQLNNLEKKKEKKKLKLLEYEKEKENFKKEILNLQTKNEGLAKNLKIEKEKYEIKSKELDASMFSIERLTSENDKIWKSLEQGKFKTDAPFLQLKSIIDTLSNSNMALEQFSLEKEKERALLQQTLEEKETELKLKEDEFNENLEAIKTQEELNKKESDVKFEKKIEEIKSKKKIVKIENQQNLNKIAELNSNLLTREEQLNSSQIQWSETLEETIKASKQEFDIQQKLIEKLNFELENQKQKRKFLKRAFQSNLYTTGEEENQNETEKNQKFHNVFKRRDSTAAQNETQNTEPLTVDQRRLSTQKIQEQTHLMKEKLTVKADFSGVKNKFKNQTFDKFKKNLPQKEIEAPNESTSRPRANSKPLPKLPPKPLPKT